MQLTTHSKTPVLTVPGPFYTHKITNIYKTAFLSSIVNSLVLVKLSSKPAASSLAGHRLARRGTDDISRKQES